MKGVAKTVLKCIPCVMLSAVIGMSLLFLVFLLPKEPIQKNVKESAAVFVNEGSYFAVSQKYPFITILDNFTDALMLTQAATPNDDPFYVAAMKGTYLIIKNGGQPTGALIGYSFGLDLNNESVDYPRYWHGHQIILKPLLLIFNYAQIRFINFVVLILVSVLALFKIYKKVGMKYMIAYLAAIVCMSPSILPFSLQNSTVYYITTLAIIAICILCDKEKTKYDLGLIFCFIGIATSYFDFLTYPSATLGVPLVLAVVILKKNRLVKDFLYIVEATVCWTIGYAGMWISKWGIASIILQKNIFKDAFESVATRVGNTSTVYVSDVAIETEIPFYERIIGPLSLVMVDYVMLLVVVFFVVWLVMLVRYRRQVLYRTNSLILFGTIAIIPFLWYVVVANHTYIHLFFTFRTLVTFFFAMFCFEMSCFECKKVDEKGV